MGYIEVYCKGCCFVFCNMQNVYKTGIVKVMKGRQLSRNGTVRSWKAFQLHAKRQGSRNILQTKCVKDDPVVKL